MSIFADLNKTALGMLSYQTITIDGEEVEAVFHNNYSELGLGVGMESTEPALEMLTEVASTIEAGIDVSVDGVIFKTLMPIESDGDGMSIVRLTQV